MKHIWSILCEKSSIDFESNLLSIFNCLEEIKLNIDRDKMPKDGKLIVPVNIQIVIFWTIEDSSQDNIIEIKGELIDPNGAVLNNFESTFNSKKGNKRFRSRINVSGMRITDSGRYYYKIYQKTKNKYEVVSELPLDVDLSFRLMDKKTD